MNQASQKTEQEYKGEYAIHTKDLNLWYGTFQALYEPVSAPKADTSKPEESKPDDQNDQPGGNGKQSKSSKKKQKAAASNDSGGK